MGITSQQNLSIFARLQACNKLIDPRYIISTGKLKTPVDILVEKLERNKVERINKLKAKIQQLLNDINIHEFIVGYSNSLEIFMKFETEITSSTFLQNYEKRINELQCFDTVRSSSNTPLTVEDLTNIIEQEIQFLEQMQRYRELTLSFKERALTQRIPLIKSLDSIFSMLRFYTDDIEISFKNSTELCDEVIRNNRFYCGLTQVDGDDSLTTFINVIEDELKQFNKISNLKQQINQLRYKIKSDNSIIQEIRHVNNFLTVLIVIKKTINAEYSSSYSQPITICEQYIRDNKDILGLTLNDELNEASLIEKLTEHLRNKTSPTNSFSFFESSSTTLIQPNISQSPQNR